MFLNEGINDKNALKIVFLAGGPGSGKNYVANKVFGFGKKGSFGSTGFKLVSFDAIFEYLLKKNGYPTDLSKLPDEERKKVMDKYNPKSLYQQGRKIVKRQLKTYMKQGIPIIFDGTGQSVSSYMSKKWDAEDLGYDAYMIFVDTSLETALKRNAQRERRLPDDVVEDIYDAVSRNKKRFAKKFGDNFIEINNEDGTDLKKEVDRAVTRIINRPLQNPIGKEFLETGVRPPPPERPKYKPKYKSHSKLSDFIPFDYDYGSYGSYDPYDDYELNKDVPPLDYKPQYKKGTMGLFGDPLPSELDALKKGKIKSFYKNFFDFDKFKDKDHKKSTSDKKIHNPETGNDIKLKSALGYPKDHPMYKKAKQIVKKEKGSK